MATDPTQIFQTTTAPDPMVQTMAGPATGPATPLAAPKPNYGSYLPGGLLRMLLAAQQRRPEMFADLMANPNRRMQMFGLGGEGFDPASLANMYTRQMARYDYRHNNPVLAAGSVLTPEQLAAYPQRFSPMAQMPNYTGGVGNQAPAQPTGDFGNRNKVAKPIGMAERQSPGGGAY